MHTHKLQHDQLVTSHDFPIVMQREQNNIILYSAGEIIQDGYQFVSPG